MAAAPLSADPITPLLGTRCPGAEAEGPDERVQITAYGSGYRRQFCSLQRKPRVSRNPLPLDNGAPQLSLLVAPLAKPFAVFVLHNLANLPLLPVLAKLSSNPLTRDQTYGSFHQPTGTQLRNAELVVMVPMDYRY